ncbi:MAG TPA: PhoH family protein [Planctomycetes bacterium]|nr:PhoH family protein [Planctomycetota bacterium]HIJ70094.1 PhoH family protein [Planctomycetota bacterium]
MDERHSVQLKIHLESYAQRAELFGPADSYLKALRAAMDVRISARDGNIVITGDKPNVDRTADIIDRMQRRLVSRGTLNKSDVNELITQAQNSLDTVKSEAVEVYSGKGVIEPLTKGQVEYVETMLANDLTFCIGPAGTGKTYLAVAVAVSMLKKKKIRKIVLARPAVEAGEKLGFLPGDLQAKVNPYLRPLFDSLEDMMDFAQMRKFIEMDIIEVIPLAFMRGRTLNEVIIICDEAQNTSPSQMLMVLTRLGRGSKMIITGDITQIDLEKGQTSGMIDACRRLKGIPGIGFVKLEEIDIVRHKLVQDIVQAYDKNKENT